MKREFGKKLIEEFFPNVDLTHVIDTSGAYIPGHATPTVILFGRHRNPVANTLRTVMGIRGEPLTPDNPSRGLVWTAIVAQVDQVGSQSNFVSVADSSRQLFHKHPWSIGGGGAAELKDFLDESSATIMNDVIDEIGVFGITAADDVMVAPSDAFARFGVESVSHRPIILGDEVRDWLVADGENVLFPYRAEQLIALQLGGGHYRWLWPNRTVLWNRPTFSRKTYREEGRTWWEWHQTTLQRLRTPLSIVFGEIATHNHFVLDRGGKIFNRTAPIIKLLNEASEDDHLALLGFLNSSTACFWMKQVAHPKQMTAADGIRIESKSKVPHAFSGTQLGKLPIPDAWKAGPPRERLLDLTRYMDRLASQLGQLTSQHTIASSLSSVAIMRETWKRFQDERTRVRSQMILLQEEIDFTVYGMFDLVDDSLLSDRLDWPEVIIDAGDRPFEILLGRNEDDFPVLKGIPASWPTDLQELWQRRMDAIRQSSELRLIEDPQYKRRWIGQQGKYNRKRDSEGLDSACMEWLLHRLESYFDFDGRMNEEARPTAQLDIALISVARLADVARRDTEFMQVGELYREDSAFDVKELVEELVADESIPHLPILRYKDSGLRKRAEWEHTWNLQRQEDAIDARTKLPKDHPDYLSEIDAKDLKKRQIGDISVPPNYTSADFLSGNYWRLRGKLDVPKERWVSFPYCEGEDNHVVIGWAGYDYLQLARAISAHYVDIQERLGGREDPRLPPLLVSLIELLPWLKQWHNAVDPEFNVPMGDYFEGFIQEEARQMGKTVEEIKNWVPPKKSKKANKRKPNIEKTARSDEKLSNDVERNQ